MKSGLLGLTAGLAVAAATAAWGAPAAVHDLTKAMEEAKKDGKLLFVQYGREACGNCQALKGYVKEGKLSLSPAKWVYVDLNCDDQAAAKAFRAHFKVEGQSLPFVAIADSSGNQLAARAGHGTPNDFNGLIRDAKRKQPKQTETSMSLAEFKAQSEKAAAVVPKDEARELRTWKATSGAEIKAALVEESRGALVLRREDGVKVKVALSALSEDDRKYVESLRAPAPAAKP